MPDPRPAAPPIATFHTDEATGGLRARRVRLSVVEGPDAGLSCCLDEGGLVVGTCPEAGLRLHDVTVSERHLELQPRPDGVTVTDLDSAHGTFHAGTRLGSVTFFGPALLRLGRHTEIELAAADEAVETQPWSEDRFAGVIGSSPVMRALFGLLARVASSDTTVLLEGETGTGKEALAEAIHRASSRAVHPFVVVDCGAIPRDLVASELFGHTRGAFTGAHEAKEGLIATADGGTLFLDEIGELPLELQPQLLRVIEKREVRPVGETRARKVDLRVIAATHRDLRTAVDEGWFREDLYFRLAVVHATVPPLRQRTGDVRALARHFASVLQPGGAAALGEAFYARLEAYDWPGNVRELRNVVEHALAVGGEDPASVVPERGARGRAGPGAGAGEGAADPARGGPLELPADVFDRPYKDARGVLCDRFEKEYVTRLLARHAGNISRAAEEAGIDRNYVHRLVKKHGIPVVR